MLGYCVFRHAKVRQWVIGVNLNAETGDTDTDDIVLWPVMLVKPSTIGTREVDATVYSYPL
jgi:hypothetical protein